VNGARNQFLPRARFTEDQDSGVGGTHGFHLLQNSLEGRAFADDLLKVVLGADFFLKVEFLFSQPLLQFRHLAVSESVVQCNGNVARHLLKQVHVLLIEGAFLPAHQVLGCRVRGPV